MEHPGGKWLHAITMTAALALLVFLLHVVPGSATMLDHTDDRYNVGGGWPSNDYLQLVVELHRTEPAFAARPLTTLAIDLVTRTTGMEQGAVFMLVQFLFLCLAGLALYYLSLTLKMTHGMALASIPAFFLSFSVLFSWFIPIYTYDEPLQYALLFLSLAACIRRRWILFSLCFSVAVVTRETSLFALPAMALLSSPDGRRIEIPERWSMELFVRALALAIPVVIFLLYHQIFTGFAPFKGGGPLLYQHNFGTITMAMESILYCLVVLVPPAYVLFREGSGVQPVLVMAFLLTLLINTPAIMVMAQAREARLFALPLIFIWPVLGGIWTRFFQSWWSLPIGLLFTSRWHMGLALLITLFLWSLVIIQGFRPSDGSGNRDWYMGYMILMLFMIAIHYFTSKALTKERSVMSPQGDPR